MSQLVREHELAKLFVSKRKKSTWAAVAAPFWGSGAAKTLAIATGNKIRVICNFEQPGCNPDAIGELLSLGVKVRTHPRLHAKIYMTDDFAIVGSSNVSTNGLTVEGAAAKGWIEANVADADPAFVSAVQALFNELWDDPDTRRVGKSDVERAKKVRKLWPKALAPQGSKTLFEACRENPASFSNVYVAAYDEGLEPEGGRLLKEIKAGALPPKSGLDASNFKNAWGYQFENIPDGAWLLDLSCKGKKPRFVGCAQATGLRLKAGDETDLTIALPGSVRLPGASKPFRISAAEKASLIKHAQRILKRGNLVPLSKVIHLIDKA